MAWRIAKSVVKGEIDNRIRGAVTGKIWLLGRDEPLTLHLAGNCWRDLAGFQFTFTNPHPQSGDVPGLDTRQEGKVGDMTASCKVRDVRSEEGERRPVDGSQETHPPLVNCFYLEWFSNSNGRVVVESSNYQLQLGEQTWTLDEDGENDQRMENHKTICHWLDETADPLQGGTGADSDPAMDVSMDEFQWEKFMKESDVRTDKYSKLLEQYMDHPDRDRIVAREMGWSWAEELNEVEDRDVLAEFGDEESIEKVLALEPNPLTEGADWVRNEQGYVEHPLCLRTRNVVMDMWRDAEKLGLLGETGDTDLRDMISQAQIAGAKLAGALNHLAYDDDRDGGFLVAALKRALSYLHEAIALAGKVAAKPLLPSDRLKDYEKNLFEIREEVLTLMTLYRKDIR